MSPQVVNLRTQSYDIYIGRPRLGQPWGFGNPFQIGRDGNRHQVISKYKHWLLDGYQAGNRDATDARRDWILAHLHTLRGKRLGCFCRPNACHGDVLVELVEYQEATTR